MKKEKLAFFDKVINVTFYRWVSQASAENPNTQPRLVKAFTVRSDRPWKGYNPFDPVVPPGYDLPLGMERDTVSAFTAASEVADNFTGIKAIKYYGIKPNIRLQLTQLPETVCTSLNLTIENLTLEIDITEYTAMYIEAGYSYSNGQVDLLHKFYAGIFSSYIESPNPGGRTIFTGVVGNWFVKGLRAQPYSIDIAANTKFTLQQFVMGMCSYIGAIPHLGELDEEILNYELIWGAETIVRAQSGYQVLDWLANMLSSLTKEMRSNGTIAPDDIIGAFFYNNHLVVNLVNTCRPEDLQKISIDLNRITSASFQGGPLTVTAPWNPLLLPGLLFSMNPTFFRGRMMPNTALSKLQDARNLYRPITIDVTFETAGSANQMKILAVAARLDETFTGAHLTAEARDQ